MFLGGLPFSILMLIMVQGPVRIAGRPADQGLRRLLRGVHPSPPPIYLIVGDKMPPGYALANASFNFVSIITTTGFASEDYTQWGPFIVACIFVATFLGGCSGSTAGAIKAYRLLVLFEMLANGVRRLVYPNTIYSVRYGDRSIGDDMQRAVVLFIQTNRSTFSKVVTSTSPTSEMRSSGMTTSASSECCM
jgi:trk system potassium uptake protein TrkH